MRSLIVTVLIAFSIPTNVRAEPITHSFLGVGKANRTVIVGEDGKVKWRVDLPASDGWVRENGDVLLAVYPTKQYPAGAVVEIDRDTKQILFAYEGQQSEISTAQPLGNGRFLVADLGPSPRAIVINRQGQIESAMPLQCQKTNAHMQTRMLRRLPNGHYIAPHLLDFAVKEYDPISGDVLRSIPTDDRGREKRDWPFTAIRLRNGNTLIGCTNGNRVIEVNAEGKTVWKVDNDDIGETLIDDACGVQRLPNGNTVITSYHAKGDAVKLFEVTPDKQIVWKFDGKGTGLTAGFHHFQILTTNGDILRDRELK